MVGGGDNTSLSAQGDNEPLNMKKTGSSPLKEELPYGLAVRIPGFHPGGPGSTPGMGTTVFCEEWCHSP